MKRVAVSMRVTHDAATGERRDALDQRWGATLQKLGLLAFPVVNNVDVARAAFLDVLPEALLLTGGNSLAHYGGDAPERDATERALVGEALARGIPIVGVCRGMQVLVDYFGGTLGPLPGHVRTTHALEWLAPLGRGVHLPLEHESEPCVNSYHGLGVTGVGPTLEAVARCVTDHSIEAVRHPRERIYGMMWHPERDEGTAPWQRALLAELLTLS